MCGGGIQVRKRASMYFALFLLLWPLLAWGGAIGEASSNCPLVIRDIRISCCRGGIPRVTFKVNRSATATATLCTWKGSPIARLRVAGAEGGTAFSCQWSERDESGTRLPVGPYVLLLQARDARGCEALEKVPLQVLR